MANFGLGHTDGFGHLADRALHSNENGPGDDVVANIELFKIGHLGNGADILVCQPMARVDGQTDGSGEVGGLTDSL